MAALGEAPPVLTEPDGRTEVAEEEGDVDSKEADAEQEVLVLLGTVCGEDRTRTDIRQVRVRLYAIHLCVDVCSTGLLLFLLPTNEFLKHAMIPISIPECPGAKTLEVEEAQDYQT